MDVDNKDKLNAINEQIINDLKKLDNEESKKLNIKTKVNLKPSPNSNK